MKRNRITLITISAKDVPALAAFYKKLGWETDEELPEMVFFDMGGAKFGIYDRASLARDLRRDLASLGTGAATLAQNFPDKAAVDAAYGEAIAAGGTVCAEPEEVFWGGYSGTWADPEGHVWEYAFNPYWTLDAHGDLA